MMFSVNSLPILKAWARRAKPVIIRLKALAPYAMIELVLPGGSVMALLLWLYRRRKSGIGGEHWQPSAVMHAIRRLKSFLYVGYSMAISGTRNA
jgi:hypothetical protein